MEITTASTKAEIHPFYPKSLKIKILVFSTLCLLCLTSVTHNKDVINVGATSCLMCRDLRLFPQYFAERRLQKVAVAVIHNVSFFLS